MRLEDGRRFTVIGENIHATRVVQRSGKRVGAAPDGRESLLFDGADGTLHPVNNAPGAFARRTCAASADARLTGETNQLLRNLRFFYPSTHPD